MSAIQINNVTKRYKNVTALDHISFSFRHGKIYGFLGETAPENPLLSTLSPTAFLLMKELFLSMVFLQEKIWTCMKRFSV